MEMSWTRLGGRHPRREFLRRLCAGGLAAAVGPSAATLVGSEAGAAPRAAELTIAVASYWGTLDFRKLAQVYDWLVASLVYSALVRNDEQFHPVPDLAAKWETPDDKTYVFHLRRAKFHDGTTVASEDVKATFDKVLDPAFGAPNRPLFGEIQSIEAPNPQTVILHLSSPSPALMAYLPWVGIVPKHYADQHPDRVATSPIGSGPYKFVSTIAQNETVLAAFDDYWVGRPAFGSIRQRVVPEATTRTVEIQSGDVDLATEVSFADVAALRKDAKLYVVEVPPNGFNYIGLNLQNRALADVRVRQAIAHAIDRDGINQAVYYGLATKALGPVIPTSWGFERHVTIYEYDPAKAKALLGSAGYGGGVKLRLTFPNFQEDMQLGTIIKQQLAAIGIDVDLNPQEYPLLKNLELQGQVGDMLMGMGWGEQLDPEQHMYRQFLSANQPPKGLNFVHYLNPRLDDLLNQANSTVDVARRKTLLSQAQKIVTADVPYVFLFNVPEYWAVSKRVNGVAAPAPMDRRFVDPAMKAQKA